MARIIVSAVLALIGAGAGFVASINFFMGMGYPLLAMLLGVGSPNIISNPVFMITIHSLVATLSFIAVFQIAMNRYVTSLIKALPALYVVAAFALVMLKSRGVQGVNLNPLDVVAQFVQSPPAVMFNLLIFVPFGMLFRTRGVSIGRAIGLSAAVIVGCEILQFILKLGICDVVDVLLNLFGFIFGYCLADLVISSGFRFVKVSKRLSKIVRSGKSAGNLVG